MADEMETIQVEDVHVESVSKEPSSTELHLSEPNNMEGSDLGPAPTKDEDEPNTNQADANGEQQIEVEVTLKSTEVIENEAEKQNGEVVSDKSENEEVTVVSSEIPVDNPAKEVEPKPEEEVDQEEEKLYTTNRNHGVKIRIPEKGSELECSAPMTVMQHFDGVVKEFPNVMAMREERNGQWVSWTYDEYRQDVLVAAKAFIKLGLEPYNGVGVIGFNSPEWMIADLGAIYACGLTAGIYSTNTAETCLFVASDAKTNIVVAENDFQVSKFIEIWDKMPFLKAIVQYKGELKEKRENVYTWNEFMEIGRQSDDSELKKRIEMQKANKCCTLIYTSGTTGNPKGVMLSHDNITYSAKLLIKAVDKFIKDEEERHVVSYLPLSHIAAQIVDIFGCIAFHATATFARPDALKGTLAETLRFARPTIFLGVPRVYEKIEEKLRQIGQSMTGIRKRIGTWAKGVALKGNINKEKGQSTPFGFSIAEKLLRKITVQLGFDRCKLQLTGAAPISLETLRYFQSINIPLMELYGMSECTGGASLSLPSEMRTTSVGKSLSDVEISIFNQDKDGSGEICMRGRFVFMGYLENEDKTKEAIDDEGWLHSGDVGRYDEDGYLYITGRIKELIITAGGENIAPVPIEDHIKAELPFVSNAMVVGDRRKFLSVLLTPKVVMDPETGGPTPELSPTTKAYCEKLGLNVTQASEIAPLAPEVLDKEIKAGIVRANQYAVSRAGTVQKFILLTSDFSIVGGELGPTLKLRRPQVSKYYKEVIDDLYNTA